MSEPIDLTAAPVIRHLAIRRFRGIEALSWYPAEGVNVVLGGGDVGKTTILDAIGLLLSPTNPSVLSDNDYYRRHEAAGFEIEAIVTLPPASGISQQARPSWPWEWDGANAVIPSASEDGKPVGEQVYKLRVRGTEDLELVYEIVQPDGTADSLTLALRRAIGLVRLSGDDRNDRDLRLVQGSALDRLLSDKGLRSRIANEVAKHDVRDELLDDKKTVLKDLDTAFKQKSLPSGLDLAVTGSQGISITSLIGLTADRGGVQLPLASWGAGTRRLSALAIAEQNQGEFPITLVDEVERGLEPYRQRTLMQKLQAGRSQVFVTTHSPAALSAATDAAIWFIDHKGAIGPLDAKKIAMHRARDPETFLSRLSIVAEGATERGFLQVVLHAALKLRNEQLGLHLADGGGHEATLDLIQELSKGGLSFACFADDEGKHDTRWARLKPLLGDLLFRWASGCIEENILRTVPDDRLEEFLTDPEGVKTGQRLRILADRLGISDKSFDDVKTAAAGNLRQLIIDASLGTVPAGKEAEKKIYNSHAQDWFKSVRGGRELGHKLFAMGLWPAHKAELLPFCNAIRTSLGLAALTDIEP